MDNSFDFVIVGGGTAGLVLAARLTEDPKVSVVVLEAGDNRLEDPKINIPGLATTLYDDPVYDYSVSTVPQPELYGKRVKHGRGKVLGGSSAINVLGLVFPTETGMDSWAKLGNRGWGWQEFQPYLRKFNTYNAPSAEHATALGTGYVRQANYGTSGPIHASFPEVYGPLTLAWAETFANLGLPANGDPMSGSSSGGYNTTSSINPSTKERSHAGNAYLALAASRANLRVVTQCLVERIDIDTDTQSAHLRATGVRTVQAGTKAVFTARREVLICAGVFQSPQLLELSGIGNPEILSKHGIHAKLANVNVGENLQDHALTGYSLEVAEGVPTIDMIRDPKVAEAAFSAYMTDKSGPLTTSFHSAARIPLQEALVEPGRSEVLEIIQRELSRPYNPQSLAETTQYKLLREIIENPQEPTAFLGAGPAQAYFEAETQKDLFAINDPHNFLCLLFALSHPFSRGTVHIQSAEPKELPAVDPRYYSHPLDLEIMARHLLWSQKIRNTKPLADSLKPNGVTIPRELKVNTVECAKEHIRRNTVTYNHPCGTCAMMPETLGGVVDDRLRVYGILGLRIIDASIIPLIPKVNPQSTVYALAEKGADLIKEDHALQRSD